MFVSCPELEFGVPPGLGDAGSLYWRGVGLTGNMPWFVATMLVRDDGVTTRQTLCLWWDTDLAPLLRADDGRARLVSLQRMVPSAGLAERGWELRTVREVWVGRDAELDDREVLIFRHDDGSEVCSSYAMPVSTAMRDRRLVKSFHGGTRKRQSSAAPSPDRSR